MGKYFCGFLLLFGCVCARARADAGAHWVEVRTPHFTVLTDSSERDARKVATQFERMRVVFDVVMPEAKEGGAAPVVVLALKDKKGFRALEPDAYLGKSAIDLSGLFVRTEDTSYILLRLDASGDHPFATVYHEYTHYMLRKAEDWMPLWLQEGLAEFYQNADLQDKTVHLGQPSGEDILYLRQNRLLPLTTLLKVDYASPYYHDEEKGSVFYAEAWALTHYIEIWDRMKGTNHLEEYAKLVKEHADPVEAAETVFGDLKKLEENLNAYVQQDKFQEFKMTTPMIFTESSFETTPVSGPSADAIRADVLLTVQRSEDAEDLLEAVLKEDPKNALAHETMGALKFRAGDLVAAKKWYGEAVGLDSHSYLAYYYFAATTLRTGDKDHDAAIEANLKMAMKLNEDFAPAYDALAQFYSSRRVRLSEAHMMTLKAVQLEPENFSYRVNAAMVLAGSKQYSNAEAVLKAAARLAKTAEEKETVRKLIAEVQGYEGSGAKGDDYVLIPSVGAHPVAAEKEFPTGAPVGAHRWASGVLRGIKCLDATVLTLRVEGEGKAVPLYTNDYYKVVFTTSNFNPEGELMPCKDIEGMKGKVEYGEVKDDRVAGQIVAIELSK